MDIAEGIHGPGVIAARPHFRQEGNDIHFFLSNRVFHSLSASEAEIWEKLKDGPISSTILSNSAAVQSLTQLGMVEVIAPIHENDRRRILVIEPHCDDAALSIGGTMWTMRNEVEFHILTMASRSNYTTAFHLHRNYFDRSQITTMRKAEGELFAKKLGGYYYCSNLAEATLRYNDNDWDLEFFNAHEVPIAVSNNRRAPNGILNAWTDRVKEFLSNRTFDEIWLPLGAGTHSDHDLTRNAGLRMVLKETPRAVVRLYEDVPYGAQFQKHTQRILQVLKEAGAALTPWWQNVTGAFTAKVSLLNIFASQFKASSIREGVERSATTSGSLEKIERLWTLERLPSRLPERELWIGAPEAARAGLEARSFCKKARAEKRVAIFAISASGRWADDLSVLSDVFPAAKFVVYAAPKVSAEFQAFPDASVDLQCLDGRWGSWLKAAWQEVSTGHRLIIAGDAVPKARGLAMLWPTGHKLVVAEMDGVIQALRLVLDQTEHT